MKEFLRKEKIRIKNIEKNEKTRTRIGRLMMKKRCPLSIDEKTIYFVYRKLERLCLNTKELRELETKCRSAEKINRRFLNKYLELNLSVKKEQIEGGKK